MKEIKDFKRLNILNDFTGYFKFWWEMHTISVMVCGDWFGVTVYPSGKIVINNDLLADFICKNARLMK